MPLLTFLLLLMPAFALGDVAELPDTPERLWAQAHSADGMARCAAYYEQKVAEAEASEDPVVNKHGRDYKALASLSREYVDIVLFEVYGINLPEGAQSERIQRHFLDINARIGLYRDGRRTIEREFAGSCLARAVNPREYVVSRQPKAYTDLSLTTKAYRPPAWLSQYVSSLSQH